MKKLKSEKTKKERTSPHGRKNNQKLKPYLIYKYVMENLDENKACKVSEIQGYLKEWLGIDAERRSIYSDIDEINKLLYSIEEEITIEELEADIESGELEPADWQTIFYSGSKKGYYIPFRKYSLEDVRAIVECIYSAKFLTERKAKDLVNLVTENLVSKTQAEDLKHDAILLDRGKTTNKTVFENVVKINSAMKISSGLEKHTPEKISFKYTSHEVGGKEKEGRKGEKYIVSPYKLIINDGNYYLIAHDDKSAATKCYRVDRMKEIRLLNIPRAEEDFYSRFEWRDYAKKHFGMFGGKTERVTLRFINPLYDTVVEKFGTKDLYYNKVDSTHFSVQVEVVVNEQFFGWLCSLGRRVVIISPTSARERYLEHLKKIQEKY